MQPDLAHAVSQLRREAILGALYLIYPRALGQTLLAESLPPDIAAAPAELARDLDYLLRRGSVARAGAVGRDNVPLYRLTAAGIEAREAHPDHHGVARAARMLRLRVLQAQDLMRPQPISPRLIALALAKDADLDPTEPNILRALAYLAEQGLVECGDYRCEESGGQHVFCPLGPAAAAGATTVYRLTAAGIDYLAGEGDSPQGIARPAAW